MSRSDIASSRVEPTDGSYGTTKAGDTLPGIRRHGSIDRLADHLGDRDATTPCFLAQPVHLILGQRDLRADHAEMISKTLL